MLVNSSSRESTLSYIARILRLNEKRAQILGDERSLAGDGFMLNLLSVMQMLAVKVCYWKYHVRVLPLKRHVTGKTG
jgi:ubiquitin conjugation factor E4 B